MLKGITTKVFGAAAAACAIMRDSNSTKAIAGSREIIFIRFSLERFQIRGAVLLRTACNG